MSATGSRSNAAGRTMIARLIRGGPATADIIGMTGEARWAPPGAAGGPGAACALAGRRSQAPALKAKAAADRRRPRLFSRNCPNSAGTPPENCRISPILGTRASVRLAIPDISRTSSEGWRVLLQKML